MKRLIVTGGNGQLGRSLKKHSAIEGIETASFIDIDELDLTSEHDVDRYFSSHPCDILINCAAYTNVDRAETDAVNAREINVEAVRNLGRASRKYGFRIIHISTDYVFPGDAVSPYKETDGTGPNTVYGETKLMGEQALLEVAPKSIVIRTSWLYSEYGKNFVKTMLRLSEERKSLTVVADQFGNPTYAGDLATAILQIVKGEWKAGIYHYSNEGITTWHDFAKYIFSVSERKDMEVRPVSTEEYPSVAKRPKFSALDKSKIKETFGICIPDWEDSLKKCIDIIKQNSK